MIKDFFRGQVKMNKSRLLEGAGRFLSAVLLFSEEFRWKKRELGWVFKKNGG
jgi:hypothetical protein